MKSPTTNQPPRPVWRTRAAWLAAIPASIILCLAAVPRPQAGPGFVDSNAPRLEGGWTVAITTGGQPLPIEALVSFSAGGALVGCDPNVFPIWPMTTPFYGTWAKKAGRDFVFTGISYQYDDTMEPQGIWKYVVKERVTLDPGSDSYNGQGTIEFYDPNGNFAGFVETTTHGVRIKAE
jgi:hypothetical protein